MKKTAILTFTFSLLIVFQSFTSLERETSNKKEILKSRIAWKGYKFAGNHEGSLTLKSGYLSFAEDRLIGGEFLVDMASLTCLDLEGDQRDYLKGHLKSEDFFGIEKYPFARLVITKVKLKSKNSHVVQADLTIKGITKKLEFDASIYENRASAKLQIDRTEFGIKYGSGTFFSDLQDKMIYDDFDLLIEVEY